MKITTVILALALFTSCKMNPSTEVTEKPSSSFFVGTYTDGQSQGIYKYHLNSDGTMKLVGLAAKAENPSFLALSADKKYLVSVNEIADADGKGSVDSYSLDCDSLLFLSRSSSGGAHPCFVAINATGQVLVANYTGGNVGLLQLDGNGKLSELLDVQQHTGKGTTSRQEAPHAHSAWFTPNGGVIAVDLGTNELWFSQVDALGNKLMPSEPQKLAMADGAGPRHLTFHPNKQWIYVLNELNNTIALVKKNEKGQYETMDTIATLPNDFKEFSKAADIHIADDGKFVYASNRGHNSIAIFSVNNENGSLTFIAHEPTRGEEPRNFSLSPDENFLLVANQNSNNIIAFKRDTSSGLLNYVSEIEAFKPVCILFE
jgi:6-phosphogluconolactonase